ncbi:MAG TPA: site-specific integrase [Candidatus Kapabacteria bacterium]|nr:site-specific integrase [Candidatus Kapabacteria bacterium]
MAAERWQKIIEQGAPKTEPRTISEFASEYLDTRGSALQPSTRITYRSSFVQFQKFTGDIELSKITARQCESYICGNQQSSIHSARRDYRTLRCAFDKAVEWELIRSNPFKSFKPPRAPERSTEYFSDKDLRTFLAALPVDTLELRRLRNITILAYEVGARLKELLNIEVTAVDFSARFLFIRNTQTFRTKTGKQRPVPLSPPAITAIREQMRLNHDGTEAMRGSNYLFPSISGGALRVDNISHLFTEMRRKIMPDRPGLHFHSLRHGFGTRLAIEGAQLHEIQRAMGHSTITTTEGYLHLQNAPLSDVENILARSVPFDAPHKPDTLLLLPRENKMGNPIAMGAKAVSNKHSQRRKRKTVNV